MASKKIVCIGGGSMYFGHILPDLAVVEGLKGSEISLYDIDKEKSEIMAKFGTRIARESGSGMRVKACHDLAQAVDGADFAISSIGGAGASGGNVYGTDAHVQDVLIPAKYGIYQLTADTAGPGGMMMALRSIPAYVKICREMEKRCPNVTLLNHSNPMATVCRALNKYTAIRTIGICHGVQIGINYAAHVLGIDAHELEVVWIGTNHYYWLMRMRHNGRDVYDELVRRVQEGGPDIKRPFCDAVSHAYGVRILFPDDSHAIEFYPFLAQVPDAKHMPYGLEKHPHYIFGGRDGTTWQEPQDRRAQLKSMAEALDKIQPLQKPSDPVTGEGLGVLIDAIVRGVRHIHIVNIPNQACVPNLPPHAVLELEAVTDSCGVRGITVGEAPVALAGLLQKRVAWQELVADAAVKGDRRAALHALLTDEMAIRPELAEKMLDELLAASKTYLPQFA